VGAVKPWHVERLATGDVHVRPVVDLIDHSQTDACPCGPTCEPVERSDGSYGWMYTHHSLDGREATE